MADALVVGLKVGWAERLTALIHFNVRVQSLEGQAIDLNITADLQTTNVFGAQTMRKGVGIV